MHHKHAILVLLVCGMSLLGSTAEASLSQRRAPNIVFLLTDDQVDISAGCYGNDQVKTPNLDLLAKQGILFRNHYNTTSICMASRASILTGMYEYKTGCNFQHGPLSRRAFLQSYAALLRRAGYFTGFGGKFGFGVRVDAKGSDRFTEKDLPVNDFDWWAGGPGQTKYKTAKNKHIAKYAAKYPHSTRAYAAWARDFFHAAKKSGKPFCLSISFKAPHLPFTPDPAFDHIYAKTKFRKPANYGTKNATHLAPQAKTGRQYKSYRFWTASEQSYQTAMRKYNQLIHGVDVALGMIRKALDDEGLTDNTIIIFTSDNGYSCGAHGFGGKVLPYGEASRSPLIIYDPRLPPAKRGQRRDTVTANIDMAPTILDFAGLPIPKNMDGVSLVPLLRNPKGISREAVSLMNMWGNEECQELAVVTKDWKYIYWYYSGKGMTPTEELFDLAQDRLEMKNLAKVRKYASKLAAMRKLYDKRHQHLKKHAVRRNKYQRYILWFDRHIIWEPTAPILPKQPKKRKQFQATRLMATPLLVLQSAVGKRSNRIDRYNLMQYRDAQERTQPVKTPKDWAKRRAAIVRGMEQVMGKFPGKERRVPLAIKVVEEVKLKKYVRRLITYQSEPLGRTPAYLCIPHDVLAGKRKARAVLCLHPTDNRVGHKVVLGLGGRVGRQYAVELAERGYVTLSPSYPHLANYWPNLGKLGYVSGTMKAIWDNSRALDLLAALPYVDDTRGFGAIGHSLGGHNAIYTAVFDKRITVLASSCGFDSFLDYYDGAERNWYFGKGWCQIRYMPRLSNYRGKLQEIPFDFPELLGALAPRNIFVNAPLRDSNFRWKSVDKCAAAARAVYELLEGKGNLVIAHPDSDHNFPENMRERAYKTIASVLQR